MGVISAVGGRLSRKGMNRVHPGRTGKPGKGMVGEVVQINGDLGSQAEKQEYNAKTAHDHMIVWLRKSFPSGLFNQLGNEKCSQEGPFCLREPQRTPPRLLSSWCFVPPQFLWRAGAAIA